MGAGTPGACQPATREGLGKRHGTAQVHGTAHTHFAGTTTTHV